MSEVNEEENMDSRRNGDESRLQVNTAPASTNLLKEFIQA